jgi:anti-sigma factor RsiW
MIHLRARRLLSALPDGLLSPGLERRVRAHVSGCARGRAEVRALEASAALLRRLPHGLVPIRVDAEAEERLAALARWNRHAPTPLGATAWLARLGSAPRLAALAATVALALVFGVRSQSSLPVEEASGTEAFNFVLAESLVPHAAHGPGPGSAARARVFEDDGGHVARAWIHPPSGAYLPPGAR